MTTSGSAFHGPPPAPRRLPWPDRADFGRLVALAIPVVVVQIGLMVMGTVDVIMVGHYSATDLAATALGNIYVIGLVAFGMGTLMALDPLVAQAVGAGDAPAVARAVQRGLLLSLLLSLPTAFLMWPAGPIFALLGQPAHVVPLAAAYARLSAPGVPAFLAFIVLRQSLQAMARMRPIVVTILAANVVNLALCWILVFGRFGVPTHGTEGAAIATTLSRWGLALGMLLVAWRDLAPVLRPVRRQAFLVAPLVRTLRLGAPIGAQIMLEFGAFSIVALLMGRLGTVPIAAHQVAINIASLTFMVPLGIGSAAAVLVGQAVGAGDSPRARRAAIGALAAAFGFMAVSGIVLRLVPGPLARVYSADGAVIALSAALIPIAGVFQVFDGLQVVSIGVLRGVGDTRAPMVVNVLGFWLIGFPVSLWLGFARHLGAVGLWWGLVVGLFAVATFLLVRVRARFGRELRRVVVEDEATA